MSKTKNPINDSSIYTPKNIVFLIIASAILWIAIIAIVRLLL